VRMRTRTHEPYFNLPSPHAGQDRRLLGKLDHTTRSCVAVGQSMYLHQETPIYIHSALIVKTPIYSHTSPEPGRKNPMGNCFQTCTRACHCRHWQPPRCTCYCPKYSCECATTSGCLGALHVTLPHKELGPRCHRRVSSVRGSLPQKSHRVCSVLRHALAPQVALCNSK
jgi:hypothetical protein